MAVSNMVKCRSQKNGNKDSKLAGGTQRQSIATGSKSRKVSGPLALSCTHGRVTKTGGSGNRIKLPEKRMININQGPGPQARRPDSANAILYII